MLLQVKWICKWSLDKGPFIIYLRGGAGGIPKRSNAANECPSSTTNMEIAVPPKVHLLKCLSPPQVFAIENCQVHIGTLNDQTLSSLCTSNPYALTIITFVQKPYVCFNSTQHILFSVCTKVISDAIRCAIRCSTTSCACCNNYPLDCVISVYAKEILFYPPIQWSVFYENYHLKIKKSNYSQLLVQEIMVRAAPKKLEVRVKRT